MLGLAYTPRVNPLTDGHDEATVFGNGEGTDPEGRVLDLDAASV